MGALNRGEPPFLGALSLEIPAPYSAYHRESIGDRGRGPPSRSGNASSHNDRQRQRGDKTLQNRIHTRDVLPSNTHNTISFMTTETETSETCPTMGKILSSSMRIAVVVFSIVSWFPPRTTG